MHASSCPQRKVIGYGVKPLGARQLKSTAATSGSYINFLEIKVQLCFVYDVVTHKHT